MEKTIFKKSRVFTLAICAIAIAISGVVIAKSPTVENKKIIGVSSCNVSDVEIIDYLESFGYSNIVLSPSSDCNRIAATDYSYDTEVFCSQQKIIGHEDIPTR